MNEAELIHAAADGDAQAFERLLDRQYQRIYRFAYRWCGSVADAEDITQLACIKLAKSISQYRAESAFSSWLFRLVVNCAKDWQKSQARHQGGEVVVADVAQTDNSCQSILLRQVLNQVADMGEGYKETALLVLSEGFSHKEAGALLGVKESTISWRLHVIRQKLSVLDSGGEGG